MTNREINIRDPFVLCENGKYYMYGTRAADFGMRTGGFDVYTGTDLENWSAPQAVFDSAKYHSRSRTAAAGRIHWSATVRSDRSRPTAKSR